MSRHQVFIFLIYKHTRVSRVCFFKKCNIISISTKHARHLYRKCLTPRRYIACAAASLIIILCDSFNGFFFLLLFPPFFFLDTSSIIQNVTEEILNTTNFWSPHYPETSDIYLLYTKNPHTHTHTINVSFSLKKRGNKFRGFPCLLIVQRLNSTSTTSTDKHFKYFSTFLYVYLTSQQPLI